MGKRTKILFIAGSAAIGVICMLIVFVTLIASGAVAVTENKLVFSSESADFIYDGEAHSAEGWDFVDGELLTGHTINVSVTGTMTNVGSVSNYFSVKITDQNGADVSNYYDIERQYGTLTVYARNITIISLDSEKEYDGEPLTCDEYEWESATGLIEGHTLEVVISGSRTYVGESENTIADAQVYYLDENGNKVYVTYNYKISYQLGTLKITESSSDDSGGGSGSGGSGSGGSGSGGSGGSLDLSGDIGGGGSGGGEAVTMFEVYSDQTGELYFKLISYGDYTGSSWTQTTSYSACIENTYSMDYLLGMVLAASGYMASDIQIRSYTSDYILPYYMATGNNGSYTIQTSDVYYTGSESEYSVYTYYYNYVSSGTSGLTVNSAYEALEAAYRAYVYSNYTSVPTSTNSYMQTLIEEQGFDQITDIYTLISAVATYIQNAATYNMEYDTNLDKESDIAVAFLSQYKEGICQHYATAATLLYRALGIPARYTIGYYGTTTANEWSTVTNATAHAWVEVYLDGYGWVNVEVTGGGAGGLGGGGGSGSGGSGGSGSGDFDSGDYDLTGAAEITVNEIVGTSGENIIVFDVTTDFTLDTISEGLSNYYDTVLVNGEEVEWYLAEGTEGEEGSYYLSVDVGDNTLNEYVIYFIEDGEVVAYIDYSASEGSGGGDSGSGGSGDSEGSGEGDSGGSGSGSSSGELDTSGKIAYNETDPVDVMEVYSDQTGELYFKLLSYGDYTGSGWASATAYTEYIEKTYSMDYLFGTALAASGYTASNIQVNTYYSNYVLPYYMTLVNSGSYTIQTSDVYYTGSGSTYSLNAYYYNYLRSGLSGITANSSYSALEAAYRTYVYNNYMSVPTSTSSYMQTIIAEQGFDQITDVYTLISAVASYIKNAASYSKSYNKKLDNESDIVVAFLSQYKEGVCQHYASAATLLFRALGIPARYTCGYYVTTSANLWKTVTSEEAHAWVEVYLDSYGWVNVEVTGSEKVDITVTPKTERYQYDGMEHSYSGSTLSFTTVDADGNKKIDYVIPEGYTYEFSVSGSRTEWGKTDTTITKLVIYDEEGNDVTSNYNIEYKTGTLHVYVYETTLNTYGATKVYDGTALTNSEYSISYLYEGHTANVVFKASITKVGSVYNSATIKITDKEGNDVTDMYKVTNKYGMLSVTASEFTVTAASAQKSYDGTALSFAGTYTYVVKESDNGTYVCTDENGTEIFTIEGDIPAGFTVEVTVSGSQTKRGRSDNTIVSVKVYDANGNIATSNFSIATVTGRLTVR